MTTAPVSPALSALSLPSMLLIQMGSVPCTGQNMNLFPSFPSRVEVLGKAVVWLLMEPVQLKKWFSGMCDAKMEGNVF